MVRAKRVDEGCRKYAIELSAYFDGELEGAEREALEAHLARCEKCREDLRKMAKLSSAMSTLARPAGPPSPILKDLLRTLNLPGGSRARRRGNGI